MAQGGHERSADVGSRFAGYQIYDRHYAKVGKVDDLFVDENDRPEYIGVKTGFFGGRSTLIPMQITRVNDERRLVEVNSEIDVIKDGPTFDDDRAITSEFENRVYAHFGLTREQGSSADPSAGRGGYSDYYGEDYRRAGERSSVDTKYGERAEFYDLPIDAEDEGRESARRDVAASDRESSEFRGRDDRERTSEHTSRSIGEERAYASEETREDRSADHWDTGIKREEDRAGRSDRADEERRYREDRAEVGSGMSMGDTESGEHDRNVEGASQPGSDLEDRDELRVQRSEEELRVGTREREAGAINVRKRVRTDRERMRVPKRHEQVSVERVPVEGREASEAEIGGEEVRVPVVEEEVVVEKRPVVKEELRIRKDVVEDEEIIEADLRKEEVDVYDETTRRGDAGGGSERRDR